MSEKETNKDFSYFYKLELEGINCFKDKQVLNMSNDKGGHTAWTIILGDNGTGKTTLLRVLDRMQPYHDDYNDRSTYPLHIKNKIFYKLPYTINLILTNNLIEENKSITYEEFKPSLNTIRMYSIYGDDYEFFLLSYGASRRMSKDQNIAYNNSDNLNISSLFDDSIELINAEEWLLQKELLSEKAEPSVKGKFQKQLQQVKNLLIDILPDVLDIRVKPINEANSKLLIEVETDYGWVNLRDLSFGYQTLTALIVDIAAKMMEQYPDEDNPLEQPVIILIDEIDLHLHPKWQRTVLDKLSEHFPAAQFIATSHSPLIVQAAQDRGANIVVCRKEGDRVVIDNDPDEVKGWRVDQILVSDLFELDSSRSVKTQEKVNDYILEKGLRDISEESNVEELKQISKPETQTELDKKLEEFANKYLK